MKGIASTGALGAMGALGASPAQAARLTSVQVMENAQLYRNRPDWPVPNDPNQFLYVQRSLNENTVVYTLRFTEDGALDPNEPVGVYWRRFAEGGTVRGLRPAERSFVYGVDIKAAGEPNQFDLALRSMPQLPMRLIWRGPNQVSVYTRIGGQTVTPVYAFVEVIDGLIMTVTGLWLHGRMLQSNRTITEYFSVAGGAVSQ
ncbi:MAG: DUF4833 domain-containing protein [Pseudomonadota bacterium]